MFTNLSLAAAAVLLQVGQALAPAPDTRISEWIDKGEVILTEKTNTPKPGPFGFAGVEYLREPLDRLHPDDPCARVTIRGGAQSGKSSVGQLWVCWSVKNNPKSFAIGLPSEGEVLKYNDYKLQPLLEDSPELAPRVRPVSTKSNLGSSAKKKKLFNGASILIFNLGSSNELQMISTGNLILEEVAQTDPEVGSRGAPVKQARERQAAYSVVGSKELMVSTPSVLGQCEVTKAEEAGDQRRWYGECPNCTGYFALEPEGFTCATATVPNHFACPGCGVLLEEYQRNAFIASGVWVPSFAALDAEANPSPPPFIAAADIPRWRARDCETRQPSYYVWQAMCGLISWDHIAKAIGDAKTPSDFKTLQQQTFGRAWDPAVEALSWEELHRIREDYDHGTVPSGAGLLTGMCDVQGGYLQWSVYAWGPGAEWWIVDRGVIEGDTAGDGVWQELDAVVRRDYPHTDGGTLRVEAFGLDTGFRTQRAYAFTSGRPNTYALDGRPGWKIPVIGKPKAVKRVANGRIVGRVRLWPTGTWELKSLLAWSLKLSTESGYKNRVQGRGHWSKAEDEAWTQQITAEVLYETKNAKTGDTERYWKVIAHRRNEETDIWVGARAMAWMLGVGAPRRDKKLGEAIDWASRATGRGAKVQGDFFASPAAPGIEVAAAVEPEAAKMSMSPRKWFPARKV